MHVVPVRMIVHRHVVVVRVVVAVKEKTFMAVQGHCHRRSRTSVNGRVRAKHSNPRPELGTAE